MALRANWPEIMDRATEAYNSQRAGTSATTFSCASNNRKGMLQEKLQVLMNRSCQPGDVTYRTTKVPTTGLNVSTMFFTGMGRQQSQTYDRRVVLLACFGQLFGQLVLFCINADFCVQILILQRFSKSTRLPHLCNAPVLVFALFDCFSLNFPGFWKILLIFQKIKHFSPQIS